MREVILNITSHHIDLNFILTPIAVKVADPIDSPARVKMIYIFGIRIYRQGIYKL